MVWNDAGPAAELLCLCYLFRHPDWRFLLFGGPPPSYLSLKRVNDELLKHCPTDGNCDVLGLGPTLSYENDVVCACALLMKQWPLYTRACSLICSGRSERAKALTLPRKTVPTILPRR